MRLPAVAIAGAFACGIVIGLHPVVARNASSRSLLLLPFFAALVFVLAGILYVRVDCLLIAAAASFVSWVLLGFVAVLLTEQPRPAEHVVSLIELGRLDLKTPLRWYGHLRDEPARLPWGYGYEIELSGVEFESQRHPAQGGSRLSFATRPEHGAARTPRGRRSDSFGGSETAASLLR